MLSPENPVWVEFARNMGPLAAMSGMLLGQALDIAAAPPGKVLDIAAGHGMFGISLAQVNAGLEVTALDWRNVLAVAEENARTAGVSDRFHLLPGSAFDVPFGEGYSLVLLPNILHHFDPPTCEQLLRKCRAALAPNGRVVIVEFVPDDDRSGPPDAVCFGLVMLATTPAGDAYTYAELDAMLRNAGFTATSHHQLPPSPARVLIAAR
jgi:ubiquinone/menaquinone biosynthesis C-methylase UbiE